jgi:hypothetical protein
MDTFVLKLLATPLLILAASLASRGWGEIVGGWLVGLPLTSGPVSLFLALDHGTGFAAAASLGALAGAAAEAVFGLTYGIVVRHVAWPGALAVASVAFALAGTWCATYPIFAAVLASFSRHGRGAAAAIQVVRGLLTELFASTGFFAMLALTLEPLGIAAGFTGAIAVALLVQAGSWQVLRRRR